MCHINIRTLCVLSIVKPVTQAAWYNSMLPRAPDELLQLFQTGCKAAVHCNHLYKPSAHWKILKSSLSKNALPTVINPSCNATTYQLHADNIMPLISIHSENGCGLTSLNKSCRTDKYFNRLLPLTNVIYLTKSNFLSGFKIH